MGKKILIFVIIILAISSFGCGDKKITEEKTEEEVLTKEETVSEGNSQKVDIYNMKEVAQFIIDTKLNNPLSVDEFMEEFKFDYFDINDDDVKEAILVPNTWGENIFAVMASGDDYRVIMEEETYKYGNEFEFDGEFLKALRTTGGTGETMTYMSIWKWDGYQLIKVLDDLLYERSFAGSGPPIIPGEGTTEIKGTSKKFEYIYTYQEVGEEKSSKKIEAHEMYNWNENKFEYDVEDLLKAVNSDNPNRINISEDNISETIVSKDDIRSGDIINGMTVNQIIVESDSITIGFSEEIELEGMLMYDEYNEGFSIHERNGKSIGITIDFGNNQDFQLPGSIYILNSEKLEALGAGVLENLKNSPGSYVNGKFVIKDYNCMAYFQSEFGVSGQLVDIIESSDIIY